MPTLYSSYISIANYNYNIINLDIDELHVLINAFDDGKLSFFLSGKKYSFLGIDEIKIFEHIDFINLDDYIKQTDNSIDYINVDYLDLKQLRNISKDVTSKFIKGDFGSKKINSQIKNSSNKEMDIFISHSSQDAPLAENLINIIRKALTIDSSKIRCTSVEGYKLPTGASTEEQLRKEIYSSKVFIAVITKHSISSTFVLFELGARWSTNAPLLPLICDIAGASILEGPLRNINALKATIPSDILQFIEDLGRHLEIKIAPTSSFLKEVENLTNYIKDEEKSPGIINIIKNSEVSQSEINSIIKTQAKVEWPDDYVMQLDQINRQKKAVEALEKGRPKDLTEEEFFKIRERAKQAWPLDFIMQLDEEDRQINSLRKLKNI